MIELNDLTKQKKRFSLLLIISYIIYATLLISSIGMMHTYFSQKESIKEFNEEAQKEANNKSELLKNFYQNAENTITAISSNTDFLHFIYTGNNYNQIKNTFLTIMQSNKNFMQLRYINSTGHEVIRYDRAQIGKKPYEITPSQLQDKSSRYYYEKCCQLSPEFIWFSDIDLNVEYGKIEQPLKPVMRIAKSIYIKNTFVGFVIINIFMEEYLNSLTNSSSYDVHLVENEGSFLIHKDPQYNWSKYLHKKINIQDEFPDYANEILSTKTAHFIEEKKYFIQPLNVKNTQELKLVYTVKKDKIENYKRSMKKRGLVTAILALFISIPFVYLLSAPIHNMYESLQNKSNELKDIANNLEKQVEKEIEQSKKKDRLLEHQSKLAALGEMIGNIAHQWRHPITRLSLILQNMKNFHSHRKLTNEMLSRYTANALEQIDYMSETIEDFRNFYKQDIKKVNFSIEEIIQSAIKIINASIKHEGIKIELKNCENCHIKGYPSQFSQVILNLMNNAKDALIEREIKLPHIIITVKKEDNYNIVTVEDNAGGIKEDVINKIFDPYFTTKKSSGTGIGLYMSKEIIKENFHGTISVKNSDSGAVFSIKIPF